MLTMFVIVIVLASLIAGVRLLVRTPNIVVSAWDRGVDAVRPQRRVRRLAARTRAGVERAAVVGLRGGVLIPDRIKVGMASADVAAVAPMLDWFVTGVRNAVVDDAARRGWKQHGELRIDVESTDSALVGQPVVRGSFSMAGQRTIIDPADRRNDAGASGATFIAAAHLKVADRVVSVPAEGEVTIGRDDANAVVIGDVMASRAHATVRHREGRLEVVDHDSANGTYLNEQRVTTSRIVDGDTVRVGRTCIAVRCNDRQATQRVTEASAARK